MPERTSHALERSLTTQQILNAEDYPADIQELGFNAGVRSWFVDFWDNMILARQRADVSKIRIKAKKEWDGYFAPERMANRFRIPSDSGRTVERVK